MAPKESGATTGEAQLVLNGGKKTRYKISLNQAKITGSSFDGGDAGKYVFRPAKSITRNVGRAYSFVFEAEARKEMLTQTYHYSDNFHTRFN